MKDRVRSLLAHVCVTRAKCPLSRFRASLLYRISPTIVTTLHINHKLYLRSHPRKLVIGDDRGHVIFPFVVSLDTYDSSRPGPFSQQLSPYKSGRALVSTQRERKVSLVKFVNETLHLPGDSTVRCIGGFETGECCSGNSLFSTQ